MHDPDSRPPAPIATTEIQRAPRGTNGGSGADAVILRLEDIAGQIAACLRDDMSPADYSRALVMRDALVAAHAVMILHSTSDEH